MGLNKQKPLILSLVFVSLLCLNFKDMHEDKEIFVPVKDYEGLYEISNLGNLYSLSRKSHKGALLQRRQLKGKPDKRGYLKVNLVKNLNNKGLSIHRIVALSFLENPENKPQVNHINGIKNDNRLCNLEWMTCKENINHAFQTGIKTVPTYVSNNMNTPAVSVIDNNTGLTYESLRKAAKALNTNTIRISRIYRGLIPNTLNISFNS